MAESKKKKSPSKRKSSAQAKDKEISKVLQEREDQKKKIIVTFKDDVRESGSRPFNQEAYLAKKKIVTDRLAAKHPKDESPPIKQRKQEDPEQKKKLLSIDNCLNSQITDALKNVEKVKHGKVRARETNFWKDLQLML